MSGKDPKKFDPARAHVLDAPERERYLPTDVLFALLDLRGDETVVDYGAGTGRLAIPVAHQLHGLGRVIAVDSSDEMLGHLRLRLAGNPRVTPVDWERGRPREIGPPDDLLYDADEACRALDAAGLTASSAAHDLPYHFALTATPTTT